MTDQDLGLIGKFHVERIRPSSRGIDHTDCRYFVLDPQHDPIAREALSTYALAAERAGYSNLAADIAVWLEETATEATS